MKVLFAVSNEEISESIVKKYQKVYKEIISYKNVYYFNAILKEIQKDKSYDRIVISEELEAFTHTQYEQIDKFIFDKLDGISDEASNSRGNDIPIILICSDRRTKSEQMLIKIFGIGVYNAILGNDRSVEEVCRLINKPRTKKEAKIYYKIDVDDVNYQPENENDVSEIEIQNIVAHYKKLGKNADQYVRSFNNISAQYNDIQLKIICKFLPLNVRAVLEEKSPKYQQVMAFSQPVSDEIRKKQQEHVNNGPSGKLLKSKNDVQVLSKPVVIPSAVNFNNVKKLTRQRNQETQEISNNFKIEDEYKANRVNTNIQVNQTVPQPLSQMQQNNVQIQKTQMPEVAKNSIDSNENVVATPKRGRGRPRKAPVVNENIIQSAEPKRRGRPRKNPIQEQITEAMPAKLPGFDSEYNNLENNQKEETTMLPGFDSEYNNSEYNKQEETTILPGFDENRNTVIQQEHQTPSSSELNYNILDTNRSSTNVLPEFDNVNVNNNSQSPIQPVTLPGFNDTNYNNNVIIGRNEQIDISNLLTPDKKIVSFVGTSKNGTSFIVNNLAEYTSSIGIKTAILDTTKNRNSYYIYTKNEEELRKIAVNSITGLENGQANGIVANQNLTVYTALPTENEPVNNIGKILETLVKNYSLVLIDCDFDTPLEYFKQVQDIYLVQTLDVLTIQPLTAFLRELKAKNILEQNKIKIILNKYVKVRGITEKTIIGGMAFYNDPGMSFMTELFDRNLVKYITIPFEEETYTQYLESVINCNISIRGYSKTFMQALRELQNMVYVVGTSKGPYKPPTAAGYNNGFSPSMNNTLNQMKKNY